MRTRWSFPLVLLVLAVTAATVAAQPAKKKPLPRVDPEAAAIKAAALDYIEGWYEGNTERMARAVHPELAKRIVINADGHSRVDQMGASKLVANVRGGGGTKTPADKQRKDVVILDRFQNAASVKVVASDWVDYLHVAKFDGRWVIINVLWELNPPAPPPPGPVKTQAP
jgi:hypothetical protein